MEKHHARLFVRHVLVNGYDVDLVLTQRFQHGLQFVFGHYEVAIDDRIVVAPSERRPRVYAHILADVYAMHCCRSAERELDHSVFRFSLCSKHFIKRRSSDRTFFRQWRCAKRILWIWTCRANLFGGVVHFPDSTGQLIDCAFTSDVHEIDLGMIEEEMVMKRSDVKTIVERS